MTRSILFAFVLLLSSMSVIAQNREIAPAEIELQRMIQDPAMKYGDMAFAAVNLDNGKVIAEHNTFRALVPASLMKIPTTWIALEKLGVDHQFKTHIAHTGTIAEGVLRGNLIVIGGGDPTLHSHYFPGQSPIQDIAAAMEQAGIQSIDGKVIYDLSLYNSHTTPSGWTWEDMGNYFGATPTALMWRDNRIEISLSSGQVESEVFLSEPWSQDSPYEMEIDIVAAEGNKDNAWFFSSPEGDKIYGKGSIPANQVGFVVKISDPDPVYTFHQELQSALKLEIPYEKSHEDLDYSLSDTLITFKSPKLSEIIRVTNQQSVNLFAEALNIALDDQRTNKTVEGGVAAAQEYLIKSKVTKKGTRQIDGSGVSPTNRLTGQFMIDLLGIIYRSDKYEVFNNSLGVGGKTGTVQWYFRQGAAQGNLRAKSGTMSGVRNYAGYVTNKYDETIAFVLMMNDYDEDKKSVMMKKFEILIEAVIQD